MGSSQDQILFQDHIQFFHLLVRVRRPVEHHQIIKVVLHLAQTHLNIMLHQHPLVLLHLVQDHNNRMLAVQAVFLLLQIQAYLIMVPVPVDLLVHHQQVVLRSEDQVVLDPLSAVDLIFHHLVVLVILEVHNLVCHLGHPLHMVLVVIQ